MMDESLFLYLYCESKIQNDGGMNTFHFNLTIMWSTVSTYNESNKIEAEKQSQKASTIERIAYENWFALLASLLMMLS